LKDFEAWLFTRRQLSRDTAMRYVAEIKRLPEGFEPAWFVKRYNKWVYVAARLFIHYQYQMSMMTAEQRARWLDLLKTRQNTRTEPPEVKEEDVRRLLMSDLGEYRSLIDVLYYGGIRITEARYLGDNKVPYEDFGNFRRYSVKWFRGPKRCDYAYLPSTGDTQYAKIRGSWR